MTHYYRHLMHTPRSVTHVLDRPLQYEQSLLPPKAPARAFPSRTRHGHACHNTDPGPLIY
jgi:hypothetical protein